MRVCSSRVDASLKSDLPKDSVPLDRRQCAALLADEDEVGTIVRPLAHVLAYRTLRTFKSSWGDR